MSGIVTLFTGDLDGEIWKDVSGFEGSYEISNLGRLKSLPKSDSPHTNIMSPSIGNGYLRCTLVSGDSTNKTFLIHRLVAIAFIYNPENKRTVNHKNGIKTDNRVENLEWATHGENLKHAFENDLSARGEKHYNKKISSKDVLEIRDKYKRVPLSELAKEYKTAKSNICRIASRQTWKHI